MSVQTGEEMEYERAETDHFYFSRPHTIRETDHFAWHKTPKTLPDSTCAHAQFSGRPVCSGKETTERSIEKVLRVLRPKLPNFLRSFGSVTEYWYQVNQDIKVDMQSAFAFVVFFIAFNKAAVSACPEGWTDARGLCLTFRSELKNFEDAEATCVALQGHLVDINSKEENDAVIEFRRSQPQQGDDILLGMRKQTDSWHWVDGRQLTWSSWASDAVFYDIFKCGALSGGAALAWSPTHCDNPKAFICRYKERSSSPLMVNTPVYGNWQKLRRGGQYSGPGFLMSVTSPSSIGCVTTCQGTSACNAALFDPMLNTCQLITGEIQADQVAVGEENEVWVRRVL